jgi:hypothetical protein
LWYWPGTYTVAEADVPATIEPKTSADTASARMPASIHQSGRKLVSEGG